MIHKIFPKNCVLKIYLYSINGLVITSAPKPLTQSSPYFHKRGNILARSKSGDILRSTTRKTNLDYFTEKFSNQFWNNWKNMRREETLRWQSLSAMCFNNMKLSSLEQWLTLKYIQRTFAYVIYIYIYIYIYMPLTPKKQTSGLPWSFIHLFRVN